MAKSTPELSELTIKELETKEESTKVMTIVMTILVGVMYLSSIWLWWKEGAFHATMMLPVVFTAMVVMNFSNWKKVKEELSSRVDR